MAVVFAYAAPGPAAQGHGLGRVAISALTDVETESVMVGCACGGRWDIDLVSVLQDRPQQLHRIINDAFPGASFDRKGTAQ